MAWDPATIALLTHPLPWPTGTRIRRAGVSSFGISGTNAHLILEQPPTTTDTTADTTTDITADITADITTGEETDTPTGPDTTTAHTTAPDAPVLVWPLSAKTPEALAAQAQRLAEHLVDHPEVSLADVGYSLGTTRTPFTHRGALATGTGSDTAVAHRDFMDALRCLARHQPHPHLITPSDTTATTGPTAEGPPAGPLGKTVFVFSGQGSQRPAMGLELYHSLPVFAEALDEMCAHLDPYLDRPLAPVMFAAAGTVQGELLDQTVYAQPALFAVQTALCRVLQKWGITPDYLIGHSVGEITAAHVGGVLSLHDAAVLVTARGRLMQAASPGGVMIAIQASEEELLPFLQAHQDQTAIAAINTPDSTVISGDRQIIEQIAEHWRGQGRRSTRLRVSHAFHSPHMDSALTPLRAVTQQLTHNGATIPIISNLTGQILTGEQINSPDYWVRQLRHTVRFQHGIQTLHTLGATTFVEISPQPLLTPAITDTLHHHTTGHTEHKPSTGTGAGSGPGTGSTTPAAVSGRVVVTGLLRKDRPEPVALAAALARLHVHGLSLDWRALYPTATPVDLPTYPFTHQHYWLTPPLPGTVVAGSGGSGHGVLTGVTELADQDVVLWTGQLSLSAYPWLADHAVADTVLVPGVAFAEWALHAGEHTDHPHVDELVLHVPLVVAEHDVIDVQLAVHPTDETGRRRFTIHAHPHTSTHTHGVSEGVWVLHADGQLTSTPPASTPPAGVFSPTTEPTTESSTTESSASGDASWPPSGVHRIDLDGFYTGLAEDGYQYGPSFQGLRAAWRHDSTSHTDIYAEVELPETGDTGGYGIHPALLDAALHTLTLHTNTNTNTNIGSGSGSGWCVRLPFAFTGVALHASGARTLRVVLRASGPDGFTLWASDPHGAPVITIESLTTRPITPDHLRPGPTGNSIERDLLHLDWIHPPPHHHHQQRRRRRS